jgi:hypothetical protein
VLLKLRLAVSPRPIGRHLPTRTAPRSGRPSQCWTTFVRNHAAEALACDFFVTVTTSLRVLYVFIILGVGTRRLVH